VIVSQFTTKPAVHAFSQILGGKYKKNKLVALIVNGWVSAGND